MVKMRLFLKGFFIKEKSRALGFLSFQMEVYLKEILRIILLMVKELSNGQMEKFIQEIG